MVEILSATLKKGEVNAMFHKIALLLVILGATNVGMTSWLHVDVIGTLFGPISPMVNVLVGLSGVYMLLTTYTTLIKKPA